MTARVADGICIPLHCGWHEIHGIHPILNGRARAPGMGATWHLGFIGHVPCLSNFRAFLHCLEEGKTWSRYQFTSTIPRPRPSTGQYKRTCVESWMAHSFPCLPPSNHNTFYRVHVLKVHCRRHHRCMQVTSLLQAVGLRRAPRSHSMDGILICTCHVGGASMYLHKCVMEYLLVKLSRMNPVCHVRQGRSLIVS